MAASGREGVKQSPAKQEQARPHVVQIPLSALRIPQAGGHIVREPVRQSPATHNTK